MLIFIICLAWYGIGLWGSWWATDVLNKKYPMLPKDNLLSNWGLHLVMALTGPINLAGAWLALKVFPMKRL